MLCPRSGWLPRLGAVGRVRGVEAEMANIGGHRPGDAEAVRDRNRVAGIEIASINDREWGEPETDEERFARVRLWVVRQLGGET
jgi:hypothetical protein